MLRRSPLSRRDLQSFYHARYVSVANSIFSGGNGAIAAAHPVGTEPSRSSISKTGSKARGFFSKVPSTQIDSVSNLSNERTASDRRSFSSSSNAKTALKESYDTILVDTEAAPGVGVITLNRPKQLNALSDVVLDELIHATYVLQNHREDVGCIVICSATSKAFAAGADISEMSERTYEYCYRADMFSEWQQVTSNGPKPVLAAVSGYCLGGGCELAMQCDVTYASAKAKFGQPEINLGIIPGAGGTQRLTRAAGKAKAMHYCLTGDFFSAQDAYEFGIVAKVYEDHEAMLQDVIHNVASTIANKKGRLSVQAVKEAVNAANELSLSQGLRLERRLFHGLFATRDQKEGMNAFLNKRTPEFVKYDEEEKK